MATEVENTPSIEKVEEKVDRKSAIAAAIAVADKADAKDDVKEEAKEGVEDKKENSKTDKKEEKASLSEDELLAQQGKELIQALRDPERSSIVIDFLAKQAGYTKGEIKTIAKTGEGTEDLTDDILDILKGEMGEEFDAIAERMAKALKKIIPKQMEKVNADIRAEFEQHELDKLSGQSALALTKVSEAFFGEGEEMPAEVEKAMSQYMDKYSPSPNMSVKEYVEDAFDFAIGKLRLKPVDKQKEAKISRNRSDASSRLNTSARVPSEDNIRRDDSKPMTRQEAIRHAIEQANKEMQ